MPEFNKDIKSFVLGLIVGLIIIALTFFAISFAADAVESPLLPDCRSLLHSSYQRQIANGDVALGIKEVLNGAAQIDYLNKSTGVYTQYFLISDGKMLADKDILNVYGSCMINQPNYVSTMATMYYIKWLTMEGIHPHKGFPDGKYGGWVNEVHRPANSIRN